MHWVANFNEPCWAVVGSSSLAANRVGLCEREAVPEVSDPFAAPREAPLGIGDVLLDFGELVLGQRGLAESSEFVQLALVAVMSIAKLHPGLLDAVVGSGRGGGMTLVFEVASLGLTAGVVTNRLIDAWGVIGPFGEAGNLRVAGGHGGDNRLPAD